jgi:GT2 family glycosyltransferase
MQAEPLSDDVILIPVHNRRATTIDALRRLARDGTMTWATVLIIDDGSTDGTADAVRSEFPAVHLLTGNGQWWWCGAIRRGMEWALAHGARRIFWLNDDCAVPGGGLAKLRDEVEQTGGVGWIEARSPGGWKYGAYRKTWRGLRACTDGERATGRIDTFGGNCVCFPREWIERIGLPDDGLFPHGIGDLDYGLRLKKTGAPLRPLAGMEAANADPSAASAESWAASDRSMRAIWRDFSSPRSFLYFPAWRAFARRHWGPVWGWFVFVAPYARWLAIAIARAIAPRATKRWGRRRRPVN